MAILASLGQGLAQAAGMLWATLWALVLGFGLSGAVQAFVSRREMRRWLAGSGPREVALAAGFGAASSSCSYAAAAVARSLFAQGASFSSSMVFMFASTNFVLELGLVMVVLLGWQFLGAELAGGLVMVALFPLVARVTVPEALVRAARLRLQAGATQLSREPAPGLSWSERLRSEALWVAAARYCLADLRMLWKEIVGGFLIAGMISALVPARAWSALFLSGHGLLSSLENVAVGPLIAALSFVCSVGNVPLAAALWRGGISFGAAISFIYADLLTVPLLLIYRRYYGARLALRLGATFWLLMALAGLLVQLLFSALGALPPHLHRALGVGAFGSPLEASLDLLALVALSAMVLLARRPLGAAGASAQVQDPVCGMQLDPATAPERLLHRGRLVYFCSERCRDRFLADQERLRGLASPFMGDPGGDRDPVCGMPVGPGEGVELEADGSRLRFCSEGCRERWVRDPERFRALPDHPAVDPVCGMDVEQAGAPSALHRGRTFYFCSQGCRRRFLADPDAYGELRTLEPGGPGSDWPVDPVCQMRVDPEYPGAVLELPEGRVYFCCRPCADQYLASRSAPAGSAPDHG